MSNKNQTTKTTQKSNNTSPSPTYTPTVISSSKTSTASASSILLPVASAIVVGEFEKLEGVRFDLEVVDSLYIKPLRMHFTRKGQQLSWDLAIEHDNVAALIYHVERKKLLLVKQFRPPVFIHAVRAMPENKGKTVTEIDWSKYPVQWGETLELCAGLMDKPNRSALEHIQEEILEECGYSVPCEKILPVKRYVTGISISGAAQNLFYAEIDDSMLASEGGGNAHEGEFITKVFIDAEEARNHIKSHDIVAPPSMLFALSWWLSEVFPSKQNSGNKNNTTTTTTSNKNNTDKSSVNSDSAASSSPSLSR